MTTAFDALNLHPQLVQAVTESGYTAPTPIQSAVIPLMLAGHDVVGQAQTGTGKTAAFALPVLNNLSGDERNVQCLVLVPTRELAIQVTNAFATYGRHSTVRALSIYGGQPYSRQIDSLKRGVQVVVGTPGRILDLINKRALHLNAIKTIVLDEADEMLSMGFIEDIETILKETPADRQTTLFSATMPPSIRRLAERYLSDPQTVSIAREHPTVEAIEQRVHLVKAAEKLAALTRLFEIEPITSALIFVRTRAGSGELANQLVSRGYPAEVLNGDLSQDTREQVLRRFRQNHIKVLVATDVAARGLDIDDISHVINYDLPDDEEVYVHRIGRTGRAGKTGIAITLVTPSEQWRLRKIEAFMRKKITRSALPSVDDIHAHREAQLLAQMEVWLRRGRTRREREMVDQLVESGYDPLDIAAAAMKIARADEKQRPISAVSEVDVWEGARTPRPLGRRERPSRAPRTGSGRESHEAGMIRVSLSKGRKHGLRPNDIVSSLAYHADIPGHTIGKILIQDSHSLVDVPEEFLQQVLSKTSSYKIRKQPVEIQLA
jgi:ATP-dependent RNA helicase DeaD